MIQPVSFRLDMEPCSASRPRVTKQGWAYYAPKYKNFLKAAKAAFKERFKHAAAVPLVLTLCLFSTQPKATKLPMPKPDIDNFVKAIMDSGTPAVWVDDWWIADLHAKKRWAPKGEAGFITLEVGPSDLS